jgi:hypothetical protein
VASSSSVTHSHSTLPIALGTTSARWPIANRGSVPIPISSPSRRTVLTWVAARSPIVVQRCPSTGTHWRASSQIGQASGGRSEAPNWIPHVWQMGSVLTATPSKLHSLE